MKKLKITVNGVVYEALVEEIGMDETVNTAPAAPVQAPAAPAAPAPKPAQAGGKVVKAPMPGTILKMNVTVGQEIKKDDLVCILEAMKMENEIFATESGKVVAINAPKGASVKTDDVIVTLA